MQVSVLKQDFSKVLSLAARFVSNRAQLPVLGNIILKAQGNSLTIMATNLEASVVANVGAKVTKEGEIAVPARTIVDIVSNLANGQVNLATDKEQLIITTENFTGTVSGINTADFPTLPQKVENGLRLPNKEIGQGLSKVVFSASIDETRPILTGVLFIFGESDLTLVSSDGFRLSLIKFPLAGKVEARKLVIPKAAINELIKLLSDSNEDLVMQIKAEENQVIFGVGDVVFSTRTLEGEFPNFEKIIPQTNAIKINIDKNDLAQAVKLAAVFARDASNIVKVLLKKDGIEINAESAKSGNQKTSLAAKVDGLVEDLEINFNYRFLEEILGNIAGEEVILNFNSETSPGVFHDPTLTSFFHLIMPVKIQG